MDEAFNKIFLSVDENLWSQLENVSSPVDAWNKLKELYEDTGMARKVTLLCDLMTTKLDNFENEESYINSIISTCNRLQGAGMEVPDEFQSAILLAGLPASYRPLIMVVEVMQNPTAEKVRQKIIHEAKWRERDRSQDFSSENSQPAMFTRKYRGRFNNFRSRGGGRFPNQLASRGRFQNNQQLQCFRCNKMGHRAADCRVRIQGNVAHETDTADFELFDQVREIYTNNDNNNVYNVANHNKVMEAFICFGALNNINKSDWILDSGASKHMSNDFNLFLNKRNTNVKFISAVNDSR